MFFYFYFMQLIRSCKMPIGMSATMTRWCLVCDHDHPAIREATIMLPKRATYNLHSNEKMKNSILLALFIFTKFNIIALIYLLFFNFLILMKKFSYLAKEELKIIYSILLLLFNFISPYLDFNKEFCIFVPNKTKTLNYILIFIIVENSVITFTKIIFDGFIQICRRKNRKNRNTITSWLCYNKYSIWSGAGSGTGAGVTGSGRHQCSSPHDSYNRRYCSFWSWRRWSCADVLTGDNSSMSNVTTMSPCSGSSPEASCSWRRWRRW